MDRPLILITNDDGIHSPGLKAAAEAVADMGDILIAAPHTQQTGMGRAFPYSEDLGIIDAVQMQIWGSAYTAYAVHGSPAYAVAHGVMELADRKPDLCISGINYGENMGTTITCSGTLGAVFEANSHGIPGIAVSMAVDFSRQRSSEFEKLDWSAAKWALRMYAKEVLVKGMPGDVDIWNINVPEKIAPPYICRVTSQSRQEYYRFIHPPKRNYKMPYKLKARMEVDENTLETDSDIYAVYVDGVISATPLNVKLSVPM